MYSSLLIVHSFIFCVCVLYANILHVLHHHEWSDQLDLFSQWGLAFSNYVVWTYDSYANDVSSMMLNRVFLTTDRLRLKEQPVTSAYFPLVVLVNNFGDGVSSWSNVLKEFETQTTTELQVYVPDLVLGGNTAFDDVMGDLTRRVEQWIDFTHPTTPVCIIGNGNGGRLAMTLRTKFPRKPIKVVTIAAPISGTVMPLSPWMDKSLRHELAHRGPFVDLLYFELETFLHSSPFPATPFVHYVSTLDTFTVPYTHHTLLPRPNTTERVIDDIPNSVLLRYLAPELASDCLKYFKTYLD